MRRTDWSLLSPLDPNNFTKREWARGAAARGVLEVASGVLQTTGLSELILILCRREVRDCLEFVMSLHTIVGRILTSRQVCCL